MWAYVRIIADSNFGTSLKVRVPKKLYFSIFGKKNWYDVLSIWSALKVQYLELRRFVMWNV